MVLEPDSILTFDRGYNDYGWFHQIALQRAYFVTRLKRGARFRVIERRMPPPLSGVTSDQTIRIKGSKPDSIPIDLRRIGYIDPATGNRYYFLTKIFRLSAKTIAEIYRARWQVELFFKWIKQHLRIKTFIGTSRNAVMSQVYVAMTTYLLLSYLKFTSHSHLTLYALAKRLEVSLFDRVDIRSLLAKQISRKVKRSRLIAPAQLAFKWEGFNSQEDLPLHHIKNDPESRKPLWQ